MTIFFVIVITLTSILAFRKPEIFGFLQFNPYLVVHKKQVHRLISHGLVHADWMHLIINMLVFYSFGTAIENYFSQLASSGIISSPHLHFSLLFLLSLVISSTTTLVKYRSEPYYNAVGASGAVSAFVFASIFFAPWQTLLFYFIPIPGIVFGVIYLVYSQYMSRRDRDHINHDAHFLGAVFGFLYPLFIDPSLFTFFLHQLVQLR